jgi:hypothetical protein
MFPSVSNEAQHDAPNKVYKLENNQVIEGVELPTNNVTYGPINESNDTVLMVPYRFDINESMKLDSNLTVINLPNGTAHSVNVELELE